MARSKSKSFNSNFNSRRVFFSTRPLGLRNSLVSSSVFDYTRPVRNRIVPSVRTLRKLNRPRRGVHNLLRGFSFSDVHKAFVCANRKIRREVLLASGNGGRNSRPRNFRHSDVRC